MVSRPPQWQQDAHRHTPIVDPVVTIQELARFRTLRTTRIDYALVFTTPKGGLDAYLPPHRPSRHEVASRRWTTVTEVDMGLHEVACEFELPSDNDAFSFEVSMGCTWQVADPAAFVASGLRDVPALVQRLVDGIARPLLRRRSLEEGAEAEQDVLRALESAGPLGAAQGLSVSCGIQIRRDEAALNHQRELREIAYEREKLEPRHAFAMREDELTAERTLNQGRYAHQTQLQDQNLDHERAMARGRQELELQEIEAKKIKFYSYYLERGGPAAMAFHLAKHPEDARLVMENLRQDQLRLMQNQLEVAVQALGGGPGGLEEHQMDEPRRLAANVLRDVLSQQLPENPEEDVAPHGEAAVEAGPRSTSVDEGAGAPPVVPGGQRTGSPEDAGGSPEPDGSQGTGGGVEGEAKPDTDEWTSGPPAPRPVFGYHARFPRGHREGDGGPRKAP